MRPWKVLSIPDRVDLRVIIMKVYSAFPEAPGLELHNQMQFSVKIEHSLGVGGS